MRGRGLAVVAAAVAVLVHCRAHGAEKVDLEIIGATALQAPQMPAGVTVETMTNDSVYGPFVAEDGTVSYAVSLKGPGIQEKKNDFVVYLRKPDGSHQVLARRGEQAPGAPEGALWFNLLSTGFTSSGAMAFRCKLDATAGTGGVTKSNDLAAWWWDPVTGFKLIAREGSPISGDPAVTLSSGDLDYIQPAQFYPRTTPGGTMVFWNPMQFGAVTGNALFGPNPFSVGTVGRTGDPAVGVPAGILWAGSATEAALNGAGQMANRMVLKNAPGFFSVTTSNDTTICGPGPQGAFQVLAREGGAVPTVTGGKFLDFGVTDDAYSIADDGRVAFKAEYWDGPLYRFSLFRTDKSGNVLPVLKAGDPAPGLEGEAATIGSVGAFGMFPDGRIMAKATVYYDADPWGGYSSKKSVLYVPGAGDTLVLAFKSGDPVPGIPGGVLEFEGGASPVANGVGDIVFSGNVIGGGVTIDNNSGLFLYSPGKGFRLLMREGTPIEVAPGDVRTVNIAKAIGNGGATIPLRTNGRLSSVTDDGLIGLAFLFKEVNATPGQPVNMAMALARMVEVPDNSPPVAADDLYPAGQDTQLKIAAPGVLSNDSDPDKDALTAALAQAPAHGNVALSPDGSFQYDPAPGYSGPDFFTYQACDPGSLCDTGSVYLDVAAGDACTLFECDPAAGCQPAPISCADGSACTVDSCDPLTGCDHSAVDCTDGDACNGVETCNPVTGCVAGKALACDDGDACNGVETCNPATGCVAGNALACDDGDACTADSCAGQGCVHVAVDCSDGDVCTANLCISPTGCTSLPVDGCCNVDTDCPAGHYCQDHVCLAVEPDVVEPPDVIDQEDTLGETAGPPDTEDVTDVGTPPDGAGAEDGVESPDVEWDSGAPDAAGDLPSAPDLVDTPDAGGDTGLPELPAPPDGDVGQAEDTEAPQAETEDGAVQPDAAVPDSAAPVPDSVPVDVGGDALAGELATGDAVAPDEVGGKGAKGAGCATGLANRPDNLSGMLLTLLLLVAALVITRRPVTLPGSSVSSRPAPRRSVPVNPGRPS